jgi:hypothetical protein
MKNQLLVLAVVAASDDLLRRLFLVCQFWRNVNGEFEKEMRI